MKMQPDRPDGVNVLTRHEPGRVWVQAQAWNHPILVPWSGPVQPWHVTRHDELTAQNFADVLALNPEIVIFGSGATLAFVSPVLHAALFARRVGVETMDTAAACRTYNVLAAEGRSVVAALLMP